jgi:hypothetical protein
VQFARANFYPVNAILGTWALRASSLPIWLSGLSTSPTYTFSASSESPDQVAELLTYSTHAGHEVSLQSTNRISDGTFVSRGSGLTLLSRSKWSVSGVSGDGAVVAVRFENSRLSDEGVNVLVRDGDVRPNLRTEIAEDIDAFGLTIGEFASITWF